MGLDANIILQGQAPQLMGPLDAYGKAMSLKQMAQQGQLTDMQLQQAQRAQQDEQAMRDVFAKNVTQGPDGAPSLNRQGVLADLYKVNPTKALDVQQTWTKADQEQRKADREDKKAQMEYLIKTNETVGSLLNGVNDQATYDQARQIAVQNGIPNADKMPSTYDPNLVKRLQMMALSTKDHLEQQWKALGYDQEERKMGVTMRGQDMADARSRDQNQIQAGKQTLETENKLRDEYNQLTKTFRDVRDNFGRIQESGKGGKGANDIALIYSYMKMLDPTSVVREGEFATAQNSGGVPDKVIAMYNGILNGQRLSPNVRAEIVNQASSLYKRAEADNASMSEQYRNIAVRLGANPDNVITDYGSTAKPAGRATGSSKVISQADVEATAKASGKTTQQVLDAARAKGYVVR